MSVYFTKKWMGQTQSQKINISTLKPAAAAPNDLKSKKLVELNSIDIDSEQFDKVMEKRADSVPHLETPDFEGKKLLVKFYVAGGGQAANSLWLKEAEKEFELLPFIKNF